jgi:hypothetical protein
MLFIARRTAFTGVTMSETLEKLLDLTLDMRKQRRHQRDAGFAQTGKANRDERIKFERRQMRFLTEIGFLIRNAMTQANRHLATRPKECQFHEVTGYLADPAYVGGLACNPIAYELRVNGKGLGETLIVELTQHGLIEASLGSSHPSIYETHTSRIDFGWRPTPLYQFDAKNASDLVVKYLAAIVTRWPLG